MQFYIVSSFYFILLSLFAISFAKYNNVKIFFIFYFLFFIFIGLFLLPNISILSEDFWNYYGWFRDIEQLAFFNLIFGKDPLFQIIVYFFQKITTNYVYIYLGFMLIISSLKFYFSSLVTKSVHIYFLLWLIFSQTLALYELTQIRAGVAISLASAALMLAVVKDRGYLALFLICLSCFIHQSMLVVLFVYLAIKFFGNIIINRKVILGLLISSFVINFILKNFLNDFMILYFSDNLRTKDYLDGSYDDIYEVSLFSFLFLLKILVIIILGLYWNYINFSRKVLVFLSTVGCFFYIAFSYNSVFALRFSEIFILFSLATLIIPLEIRKISINIRFGWAIILIVIGLIFCYSSSKILGG